MNRKQVVIGTGATLVLAGLAFAHHVPVGLSHVAGAEILRQVVFFTQTGNFGVPAYHTGKDEVPGHHDPVGLVAGDAFQVTDENGRTEVIRFEATDFADISAAVMEDVVAVINAKASGFEAIETNGYLVLEGHAGGPLGALEVKDALNGPLGKMGMKSGLASGSDRLDLTISIPDPALDLAGRPYLVLASATEGSFTVQGQSVPIGRDGLFTAFLQANQSGQLAGFRGTLDGNSDALATLSGAQLQQGFAGAYPDKMYFAYVVLDGGRIAYVSNRFTVDFR